MISHSYLYTNELPESGEGGAGGEGDKVHKDGSGSGGGKGNGKESKGEGKKGEKSMGVGEHETHRQVFGRAMLKAADLFRLEALLQHCVESFQRGLTVETAIEQLVWAHNNGPEEARTVATEYFVDNCRRIRVGSVCDCAYSLLLSGNLPYKLEEIHDTCDVVHVAR